MIIVRLANFHLSKLPCPFVDYVFIIDNFFEKVNCLEKISEVKHEKDSDAGGQKRMA
jgi:hypothetical protein